ncbi:amino acid adenylation domain-containing protein [Tengunoibacter tsumagoiensis]|uniref:AMP-dependent synthetase/ligase domain-containing protein n=1 Tax=Tengunoibacter tsumagoiensis TaxID=2014871 RepID=A0A402A2Z3_9CHLR|nr:amino acid adenylation domain-containing protein [Tengunoibacter tsumagoiensis]GCE13517.1 hypothetical protein KTT_33760 [Tengunoibacter tsumagoiensis]
MDFQPDGAAHTQANEQYLATGDDPLSMAPSLSQEQDQSRHLSTQILPSDEQQRLFASWFATRRPYAIIPPFHSLFEEQVIQRPDAIALVFGEHSLTYAALNERATHLAYLLQAVGVRPEVCVALYLERSLETVIAILAVLKAGGAYVPLDPTAPQARLAFMLSDCTASILITRSHLQARLPSDYAGRLLVFEELSEELAHPLSLRSWQRDSLQAVNLLYTSGSTGQPKGVINTHQGLYNRLFWMQDRYRLRPDDRVLQKTPYSFDVSVWEMFWPLHNGATLVLAHPEGHRDSAYLASLIQEQEITVAHFVPSMLHIFLEEPDLTQCTSLRYLFCSGEALSVGLQQRCLERLEVELFNLYGPTEAAIEVTAWTCLRDSALSTVPIGHPISNTAIVLLDEHGCPVPAGTPGELGIGGMALARGYHRRPDLTAERFRPHPCSPEPGARLYLTGDLARELPDGSFEFLGRLDYQVKLRGQRIELGEIEFALEQHPDLRACLVQVQTFNVNDQRLVAYLIATTEQRPAPKELRAFLSLKLPEYMIPSLFIYLEAWPLLSNGKIDRRALPVAPIGKRPVPQPATVHQTSHETTS